MTLTVPRWILIAENILLQTQAQLIDTASLPARTIARIYRISLLLPYFENW